MSLNPGTKLGPYEIIEPIGAGGMGEVYKAKDTRLDRTVAIKVLPSHLADNPDLKQRFEREARAVSSLNHPHICTLHDIGEQDGTDFLVMEYIEGETLADRLKKGALPLDKALRHGIEIADALDKAHRQGVIHRDLKPGNIMLKKSGAKLLDFGLAKLKAAEPGQGASFLSALPTEEKPLTEKGSILGTFQYMAPEQLEGKEADARTDIFAFGSVLYEMVTGKRAFEGKSQASLIGAIMNSDPPRPSSLRPITPPALDHAVKRCLAKDSEGRWLAAHDLMHELKWIAEGGEALGVSTGVDAGRRISPRLALGIACGMLFMGALLTSLVVWSSGQPQPPGPPTRLSVKLPRQHLLTTKNNPLILSPNGDSLVYMAHEGGNTQLFIRPLDRFEVNPIPGTEGAENPFFSPDGQWVGFFADGKLQKVSVRGGAPVVICDAPSSFFYIGASWGDDEHIVFSGGPASGLFRVSASGGTPETLTTPDPAKGENTHAFPQVLPKSNAVIFTVWGKNTHIATLSIDTGEQSVLIPKTMEIEARYLSSGHLVYPQMASLMAVPFDPDRLELNGPPGPVLDYVYVDPSEGTGFYSVSGNGSLVYMPSSVRGTERELVWVDRDGTATPIVETEYGEWPRLSPDGNSLAISSGVSPERDVWIDELARGTRTRFTIEGDDVYPVWSPDGRRIAFASNRSGDYDIYWKLADGSVDAEPLLSRELFQFPMDWSPDGRFLIFYEPNPNTRADIWILSLEGDRAPIPYINTPFNDSSPSFSPDGRFLAYVSNESGRNEIYVQSFPDPSGKVLISNDGGTAPLWSPDGLEVFYRNGDRMMSVAVVTEPTFKAGRAQLLFEGRYLSVVNRNYDVSPDGQRFVMVRSKAGAEPTELNIVLNWFEELERLVPTN